MAHLEVVLIAVNLLVLLGLLLYLVHAERERSGREEFWEDRLFGWAEQQQKQFQRFLQEWKEELDRIDENAQKRHHYLKKAINDVADMIDRLSETEKRVRDLYHLTERMNLKLEEFRQSFPAGQVVSKETGRGKPEASEGIQAVLDLYQQGLNAQEIAKQIGRPVTEVELILTLYEEELKSL